MGRTLLLSKLITALLVVGTLLAGCGAPSGGQPADSARPASDDEAAEPPAPTLEEAYRITEPDARRDAVLAAVAAFLRDPAQRGMDDDALSARLTEAAHASGTLHVADAGWVRVVEDVALVALPDGLGLHLITLDEDAYPVELSRWTVGLNRLTVTPGRGELVAAYTTLGADGVERVHVALAVERNDDWRLAWLSDEEPDWWFNARGGAVTVAPDLSRLTVVGEAEHTTDVFYEVGNAPRRTFRVEWVRELSSYRLAATEESYQSRRAWLWALAVPSPYATLVEFIERLQVADQSGAAQLVESESVLGAAFYGGLMRPDRRYQVVRYEGSTIIFRDLEGTFTATFVPPSEPGEPWLLAELSQEPTSPDNLSSEDGEE
ncbi:MAG TPA: hypothetical protein PK607_13605 [Aggregatilineales bacterium]|nr:hypothetical protein [Aggregatilineales bacterium]HQE19535.1 hypothetical protein [Aggregatilineales bacterium]